MSANRRKMNTVKQVAKLSGVSIRTLRFYDEIGLLKPAFYGENGYRYYEKEQLLALQQTLFYRELGMELAMIQKIMTDPQFDKAEALRSHRELLAKEAERARSLISTIDKTLAHLEEDAPMKNDELYLGFDPLKQAEYERELTERLGESARGHIEESKRRTKGWKKEEYERVQRSYDELHHAFTDAIQAELAPNDAAVQGLVKRHFAVVDQFWTPRRGSYIALGLTYCQHPDFRKFCDGYHPKLAEFLAEAMKVFAEKELPA